MNPPNALFQSERVKSSSSNMKTIAGYFLMGLAVLIAATGQANGQVTINFDNLACNTYVTNQYPQVTFSSAGGYTPITYCNPSFNYGTTYPTLSRGNFYGFNHYAELTLDFTRPVGALTYYTLGSDNLGVVAKIDVYRSGSFSQTLNFYGNGNPSDLSRNASANGRIGAKERKGRAVRGFPRSAQRMAWVFKGIRRWRHGILLVNPHILAKHEAVCQRVAAVRGSAPVVGLLDTANEER
jgi:hypothetical protein